MVMQYQLTIYMCSHCTRVFNVDADAVHHEATAHREAMKGGEGEEEIVAAMVRNAIADDTAVVRPTKAKKVPKPKPKSMTVKKTASAKLVQKAKKMVNIKPDKRTLTAKATTVRAPSKATRDLDSFLDMLNGSSAEADAESDFILSAIEVDNASKKYTKKQSDMKPGKVTKKKFGKAGRTCDMCGVVSKSIAAHERHARRHMVAGRRTTPGPRVTCNQCQKTFTNAGVLRTHLKLHSGEMAFKCQYCERGYVQRGNRDNHEAAHRRRHSLFTCGVCQSTFPDAQARDDHRTEQHSSTTAVIDAARPIKMDVTGEQGGEVSDLSQRREQESDLSQRPEEVYEMSDLSQRRGDVSEMSDLSQRQGDVSEMSERRREEEDEETHGEVTEGEATDVDDVVASSAVVAESE